MCLICENCFLKCVLQALIGHGAKIEASTQDGSTSLILASARGHLPAVEVKTHSESIFLNILPAWTSDTVHFVISCLICQALLQHGANIKASGAGYTSLIIASKHGYLPVVEVRFCTKCTLVYVIVNTNSRFCWRHKLENYLFWKCIFLYLPGRHSFAMGRTLKYERNTWVSHLW